MPDAAVTATNVIQFSLEIDDPALISVRPPMILGRSAGVSFTISVDFQNLDPGLPHNVLTNYMIIG